MSTEKHSNSSAPSGGLGSILGATAIAGAAGYGIQIAAPLWFTETSSYLLFSVFWATTFVLVAMVSGVQQEITRATFYSPVGKQDLKRTSKTLLGLFGLIFAGLAIVTPFVSLVALPKTTVTYSWLIAGAMIFAVTGYLVVAIFSGIFYGIEKFRHAALTTALDALLRVGLLLTIASLGFDVTAALFGVGAPFWVTAFIVFVISQRNALTQFTLQMSLSMLVINSVQLMFAALATGVLISGLPTILNVFASSLGDTTLAALILSITITRAPLVIPILALQSYLIIRFRNLAFKTPRLVLLGSVALMAITVFLAFVTSLFAPQVLVHFYGQSFALDSSTFALIVVSGGVTALLAFITPALLARNMHVGYLLSWVFAAAVTVIILLIGENSLETVLAALIAGPTSASIFAFLMLATGNKHVDMPIHA